MSKILAIETSSETCSVAVKSDTEINSYHELIPQQHSSKILDILKDLMLKSCLNFKDLDVIAVGCGPGSFTGIRLACTLAQGLSFSSDLPVIRVSSLEVIAEHFYKKHRANVITALVNAHMNQIFVGKFNYKHEALYSSYHEIKKIEEFKTSEFSSTTLFAGDGCNLVLDQLTALGAKFFDHHPNAIDLLSISERKLEEGLVQSPEDLLPFYVSGEEQWKKV